MKCCQMRRLPWFLVAALLLRPAGAAEVLSIAHRGYALLAPENTVAAFRAALDHADLVESDVRVTSDGQLVIMHDETVDRTTDGAYAGAVSALTLAQVKALDAGAWFSPAFAGERVPTFDEMLTNIVPRATALIEHKAGAAAAYVAALRRLGAVSNVVLQSFDWTFLANARALEPGLRLAALGSGALTSASLASVTNAGARIVAWEKSAIGAAGVGLVHAAGLTLYAWTVDSPVEMQRLIELGVDGIISNDPARVRQLQPGNPNELTRLRDGLVAYWRMDDGLANAFATQVADSQGTNHGTLVRNDGASHWFGAGVAKLGGCLKLEGASAFVNLPRTDGLDLNTNALTLCAWVRLPLLPSQLSTSFGAILDSTTDCYVLYLDRANKELRFKVTDANGHAARPGIPETALPTNQWIHVAATFSSGAGPASGQAAIYLNGQLLDVHLGNDNTAPVGLTGNVKTGQAASLGREGPTGGNYFTGYVDDLALWHRALTGADIARLHAAGQAGRELGELLIEPSPLLQILSVQRLDGDGHLEIRFQNHGSWTAFQLRRAAVASGPFTRIEGLAPTSLGGGQYRFTCPPGANASGYFRIEGQ